MLSRDQARDFYDRWGVKQDSQAYYEDPPLRELIRHAAFERARAVFELGCGTGRLAEELLRSWLPADASYYGVDLSSTMVELARDRLRDFGPRVRLELSDGEPRVEAAAEAFDRFLSTYVLDLLPEEDTDRLLAEAHRVLRPGGRLCLVGLTSGEGLVPRLVSWLWTRVHSLRPRTVGGCRPQVVATRLDPESWRTLHCRVVTAYGIASEVIVAQRVGA